MRNEGNVTPAERQAETGAFRALRNKLARLETENEALKTENDGLKEAVERLKTATPDYSSIASDPDFIDGYALSSVALKAKIIESYLKGLVSGGGVSVLTTAVGAPPLTPHDKPKSLAEAKKLADILIKA